MKIFVRLTNRLEEKLTNIESENKVLRQQALTMAQNNKLLSGRSRSSIQVILKPLLILDVKSMTNFSLFYDIGRGLRAAQGIA